MSTVIVLNSHESLKFLKSRLREHVFPDVKSGHLFEAIAALFGFKTHLALIEALKLASEPLELPLSRDDFVDRLLSIAPGSDADRIREVDFAKLIDPSFQPSELPGRYSTASPSQRSNAGSNAESHFVQRAKRKARKLERALECSIKEGVYQTDCQDWIASAFGFRTFADLLSGPSPQTAVEDDERLTPNELLIRRSGQARSLATEFGIGLVTAQRVIENVRPTSYRYSSDDELESR